MMETPYLSIDGNQPTSVKIVQIGKESYVRLWIDSPDYDLLQTFGPMDRDHAEELQALLLGSYCHLEERWEGPFEHEKPLVLCATEREITSRLIDDRGRTLDLPHDLVGELLKKGFLSPDFFPPSQPENWTLTYHLRSPHTFRCLTESEVDPLLGIDTFLQEKDELCSSCKKEQNLC